MKQVTTLLQKYRQARLDVLLGRAGRHQRAAADASARCAAEQDRHAEALRMLATMGDVFRLPQSQREVVLAQRPSCEALVTRRAAALAAAGKQREAAEAESKVARQAVQAQERALLRGEELNRLLRESDRRRAEVAESLDDEDLASARAWRV
jgi:hypothetical protein